MNTGVEYGWIMIVDLLCAIPMVEIDVQNPDTLLLGKESLPRTDCDGSVVNIAVSSRAAAVAVVAWWSTEREDRFVGLGQEVGGLVC